MNKDELKEFIINELGGLKTIHIGTPKSVINRQFVYEQDIDRLAEKLTPISPSPIKEEVFTLLDAMEKRLNPEYANDVYTWHKIKEVLEDEVTKLSNRISPIEVEVTDEEIDQKFPDKYDDGDCITNYPSNKFRREGAVWMRDLLTKGKEEQK